MGDILEEKSERLKKEMKVVLCYFLWEMVRTTKIRTSKTKKISETSVDDQNIEKIN
jgi:hypothetical protein